MKLTPSWQKLDIKMKCFSHLKAVGRIKESYEVGVWSALEKWQYSVTICLLGEWRDYWNSQDGRRPDSFS